MNQPTNTAGTNQEIASPCGLSGEDVRPAVPTPSWEQQVTILKQQLAHAQRMATIGELSSTTTHEFNNLMMTILNYAKMGLRHEDEATRTKAFQRILDASTRATKIAGSVLAMARRRKDTMEPIDLRSVIEDSMMLLEREFRKYRVDLTAEIENAPPILGSGNELQRLLVNLLINARQATPEGGYVRIRLYPDPQSGEVVLSVRDNGCGIPSAVLPRIFDPFFTTKSGPDATGKGGTGVGLHACKEIVEMHRGRIRVESSVGKGTAFILRFPAVQTAAHATPCPPAAAS
ncbi:MAG: two-component sensor histidine kinase [Pirellulaceae bacterium]|nr:MAG: two-component sensor histidine kinase [Pirellulaceae bacterium]